MAMKSAMRRVKDTVYQYTEPERRIREATSSEDCVVSITLLMQITQDCQSSESYMSMFDMLWKRVTDHQFLKHVEKGLTVVEHLLLYGTDRFRSDMKFRIDDLKRLKRYQFLNKDDIDQGETVRNLAGNVVKLVENDKYFKKEKKKADKHPTFGSSRFGSYGSAYANSSEESSSSEKEKRKEKKKKKKKKKKKEKERASLTFDDPAPQKDPFGSSTGFPAPAAQKTRSPPQPQKQPEPMLDLTADFLSGRSGSQPATRAAAAPAAFDDFLTGVAEVPQGKVSFGFTPADEQKNLLDDPFEEEEKEKTWLEGASNLVDLSNPLAKPAKGGSRVKTGQSMSQMVDSNDISIALNPQAASAPKPKMKDPFAAPKMDPFASFDSSGNRIGVPNYGPPMGAQPNFGQPAARPQPQAQPFGFGQPQAQPFGMRPIGQALPQMSQPAPYQQPRAAAPQPFGFSSAPQPAKKDPFQGLFT